MTSNIAMVVYVLHISHKGLGNSFGGGSERCGNLRNTDTSNKAGAIMKLSNILQLKYLWKILIFQMSKLQYVTYLIDSRSRFLDLCGLNFDQCPIFSLNFCL